MLSGDEEIEGGILGVDARRSRGTKPREIGLQFREKVVRRSKGAEAIKL
jgi:hypothetical protein